MWNRRVWCRLGAAGLLGLGLPAARAQGSAAPLHLPAAAAPRVLVAVEQKAAFCYLPLTIAERLGYFAREGLDVQLQEFPDPGQSLQATLSGLAQVYSGPYSSTISLQARGLWMQSFVLQGRTPKIVFGVPRQSGGRPWQLRDLREKRIGVMALGSASHRMARLLLGRANVGEREVQYVVLPSAAAALAAFRSGQIDALCHTDPLMTRLEREGELRVLADTRTVRGSAEVFGGPMPAGCLSAADAFIAEHPRQIQALTNALVSALKWLQTAGPSDLIKAVPEPFFQGDRALYLAAFSRAREAWTPDGVMPQAGPGTVVRLLAQLDDAQWLRQVDLARTFTNQFALRAKAKFGA